MLLFPVAVRIATIREHSLFAILLRESLIRNLRVLYRRHNGSRLIYETNDFIIYSFTLMKLAFKLLSHFKAELVIIIEATIMSIIQNDPAGTSYIAILINRFTIMTRRRVRLLPQTSRNLGNSITNQTAVRILIALKQGQITGATRGAMHLQSQFNNIASLKSIQVISQLFSINMLSESRTEINLSLTTLGATMPFARSLSLRNILLTDFNTIQYSDGVAFL